jgi:phosphate-selective porin OprO/OprP
MPRPAHLLRWLACLSLLLLAVSASAQSLGVVKPAGKEPTLTIGGLLQVQADFGDRGDARFANDRFYIRRARLNATGKFLEEFDFRLELDLAGNLGNTTGLRAQMTDGYITWNRYREANVRVGQFKTPFGFEQLYGDPRLLTIERTLANDRLTLSRQIGVQVGGELLDQRLTYALGSFNGNGVNNGANDDNRFLQVGRLTALPWRGSMFGGPATWSVGVNGYSTHDANVSPGTEFGFDSTPATADRDNIFAGKRDGQGIDTQLVTGRFEVWAEGLKVTWKPTSLRPRSKIESEGWYLQAGAFVVPQRFQVVLKSESFDPRKDAALDRIRTETLGLNWYLKGHDLKLMADYLRVHQDRAPKDQDKLIARLQVIF